jgi:hypothetical protein
MLSSLVALTLCSAPLSFEEGEFLGFTEDGNQVAWLGSLRLVTETPPRLVRHATVRHLLEATEQFFELEVGPIDGTRLKPSADVAKWEAWKRSTTLVKPTSVAGVKVRLRADGKDATSWGGTGKKVKVELSTERLGVTHLEKSEFAEAFGKKLRKTTGSAFIDPTGRRVAFVLTTEAGAGEPVSNELLIAFAGPTTFTWFPVGTTPEGRREKALLVEKAGFAVGGGTESPRPGKGLVVFAAPKLLPAAQQLAQALGGTATKGKVDTRLSDLVVTFDVLPGP